jgi:hypothetical protein
MICASTMWKCNSTSGLEPKKIQGKGSEKKKTAFMIFSDVSLLCLYRIVQALRVKSIVF